METRVQDEFPLSLLECQFYEMCKAYDPKNCQYNKGCTKGVKFTLDNGEESTVTFRKLFRSTVEPYIVVHCLEDQIDNIDF